MTGWIIFFCILALILFILFMPAVVDFCYEGGKTTVRVSYCGITIVDTSKPKKEKSEEEKKAEEEKKKRKKKKKEEKKARKEKKKAEKEAKKKKKASAEGEKKRKSGKNPFRRFLHSSNRF